MIGSGGRCCSGRRQVLRFVASVVTQCRVRHRTRLRRRQGAARNQAPLPTIPSARAARSRRFGALLASGGVYETYDHVPGASIERGVGQGGDLAVLAAESPLAPETSSLCPDRIAVLHPPRGRAAQVSVLGPAERGAMK